MPAVAEQVCVPALRFPRYEEALCSFRLGELMEFRNGMNISREDYSGDVPFVNVVDVLRSEPIIAVTVERTVQADSDSIARYGLEFGDLLFQRSSETRGEVGSSNVYLDNKIAVYGGFVIRGRPVASFSSLFLNYQLKLSRYRFRISRLSGGSTRYNIGQESLSTLEILLPKHEEQEKIAGFLTAVNERIGKLKRKKELLEEYKRGMMQKLFSQEVRFKNEHGHQYPDWEVRDLGVVLNEVIEKTVENDQHEVLSSTANGLFRQSEYFNRQVASKDNAGYKIVRLGHVVLSPQNLWLGNINLNLDFEVGIVSPSYKVFEINQGYSFGYMKDFLRVPRMFYEYGQASEQGASIVRRNLSLSLFSQISFFIPCLQEQERIAKFLTGLDEKLANLGKRIEKGEEFKRGLLQKMFV